MISLNKVIVMGNLTRVPEVKRLPSGVSVCEFGLALNRQFTQNGERKEETDFVEVNVWDRQAEVCAQYLDKGSTVFVEGRLKQEKWTDRASGQSKSRLVIRAERVQFVNSRNGDQGKRSPSAAPQSRNIPFNQPRQNQSGYYSPQGGSMPATAMDQGEQDDDIPF